MKTYRDIINAIRVSPGGVYVQFVYPTGTQEFLPIDKWHFFHDIAGPTKDMDRPYPCAVEVNGVTGDIYIYPQRPNNSKIN